MFIQLLFIFSYSARLKPLDAYVAYGYVSNKSCVELVHRRAFIKDGAVRKPLSDNMAVEKALSQCNIICLNDLSHEIYEVGNNFDKARQFLCPFQLSVSVGHYEKKVPTINDDVESKGGFMGRHFSTRYCEIRYSRVVAMVGLRIAMGGMHCSSDNKIIIMSYKL